MQSTRCIKSQLGYQNHSMEQAQPVDKLSLNALTKQIAVETMSACPSVVHYADMEPHHM